MPKVKPKPRFELCIDEGSFFDHWDLYDTTTQKCYEVLEHPKLVPNEILSAWFAEIEARNKLTPQEARIILTFAQLWAANGLNRG